MHRAAAFKGFRFAGNCTSDADSRCGNAVMYYAVARKILSLDSAPNCDAKYITLFVSCAYMLRFSSIFVADQLLLWASNTRCVILSITFIIVAMSLEFIVDIVNAHTGFVSHPKTTSIVATIDSSYSQTH